MMASPIKMNNDDENNDSSVVDSNVLCAKSGKTSPAESLVDACSEESSNSFPNNDDDTTSEKKDKSRNDPPTLNSSSDETSKRRLGRKKDHDHDAIKLQKSSKRSRHIHHNNATLKALQLSETQLGSKRQNCERRNRRKSCDPLPLKKIHLSSAYLIEEDEEPVVGNPTRIIEVSSLQHYGENEENIFINEERNNGSIDCLEESESEDIVSTQSVTITRSSSNNNYNFKWNNYNFDILQAFEDLLQNEIFCDVSILCNESNFTSIKAHKIVLSSSSEFFKLILISNPCKHSYIMMPQYSAWEIQIIIDFMYKGQINFQKYDLQHLYSLAKSLQIQGLTSMLEKMMHEKEGIEPPKDEDEENKAEKHFGKSYDASIASEDSLNSDAEADLGDLHSKISEEQETAESKALNERIKLNGMKGRGSTQVIQRRKQARPRRRSGDYIVQEPLLHCKQSIDSDNYDDDEFIDDEMNDDLESNSGNDDQDIEMYTGNRPFFHPFFSFQDPRDRDHLPLNMEIRKRPKSASMHTSHELQDGKPDDTDLTEEPIGLKIDEMRSTDEDSNHSSFRKIRSRNQDQILDYTTSTSSHNSLSNNVSNNEAKRDKLTQLCHKVGSHISTPSPLLGNASTPTKAELLEYSDEGSYSTHNDNIQSPPDSPLGETTAERRKALSPRSIHGFELSESLGLHPAAAAAAAATVAARHHPNVARDFAFPQIHLKDSPPSPGSFFLGIPNGPHGHPLHGLGIPPPGAPPPHHRHAHASIPNLTHSSESRIQLTPPGILSPSASSFPLPLAMTMGSSGQVTIGGPPTHPTLPDQGSQSHNDAAISHCRTGRKESHHSRNNPLPWPGLPLGSAAPFFGRHRAQHSAPRGGPPRAWSNADLTEALHNVWNKKMTTSQASRIFGIPYNSLLMYVRGKYGKSLKLDLLKKGLDMALENANNNGNSSEKNGGNNQNNNSGSYKSKNSSSKNATKSLNCGGSGSMGSNNNTTASGSNGYGNTSRNNTNSSSISNGKGNSNGSGMNNSCSKKCSMTLEGNLDGIGKGGSESIFVPSLHLATAHINASGSLDLTPRTPSGKNSAHSSNISLSTPVHSDMSNNGVSTKANGERTTKLSGSSLNCNNNNTAKNNNNNNRYEANNNLGVVKSKSKMLNVNNSMTGVSSPGGKNIVSNRYVSSSSPLVLTNLGLNFRESPGASSHETLLPSTFNPFAAATMFNDFQAPFPFPLSHILPPNSLLTADKMGFKEDK